MRSDQSAISLDETKSVKFARDHWLLAIALLPLLRILILAEPPAEMAAIQLAERFLWISCWVFEAAIIVFASRDGFRVVPFWRALPLATRWLLAVWLASLSVATVRATYIDVATRSALEWLLHAVFAGAVWHLVMRDPVRFVRMFDRFSIAVPRFTAFAGVVAMALVYRIGISSDYPFGTDVPGFAHIRHSGYIFAPAMIFCLARLATAPRMPVVAMILLVVNVALCLWFGSRGPFLALIGGLTAAFVLFADFRRPSFYVQAGMGMIAGAALSLAVPSPGHTAFNAVRRFFAKSADASEFSSGRTEFWNEAVVLILDRPLFGFGGGQFQMVSSLAANMYRHPHDFVLQVLFDWGFIGGGAFLGLLALAMTMALKARRNGDSCSNTGLFGLASMLSFALVDGILFYPYTIMLTVIFFAATLSRVEQPVSNVHIAKYGEFRSGTSG